jgi:amino acid transporter
MAEITRYKRSLGLPELVSLGVGGTIGSGIFVVLRSSEFSIHLLRN